MTTRQVTGSWLYPDGSPARGEVVFTPVARAYDGWVNPGGTGPTAPIGVTLDGAGALAVDLPVTPADEGWVWLVIEKIVGGRLAVYPLTLADDPAPLDLAAVTPDLQPDWWRRHHNLCRCAPRWGEWWC